ncbi:hydroxymethylbilane synthase [Streptomyces sp. BR123]|uniref:hydroxymethylbilane synthase n=1 Tax=Streptomyces sp. BR123 TaxID=2749828 RepID=UPI0015C4261A|nr:hydroxymethylbilane synthase [Streptomyces sp. BR123]NXY93825.1 hydroxymethylbilane synthase [Streptomyces sp. BR123]
MSRLRIGARASLMSLTQTAPLLSALSPTHTVLIPFHEAGGDQAGTARAALESEGVFTNEIEAALLAGEIDIAVHCLKDTPTHDTPGLVMGGFRPRGDLRDALVHRNPHMTLDALPSGARIGTAAIRRRAYLRRLRPDLEVVPLRGPADERLAALDDGAVDGLILGTSGLDRLGLAHRISERISPHLICPPLGAAAIVLQCRKDDEIPLEIAAGLSDPTAERQATAERTVLRHLGGFCNAPLAGYATIGGDGQITVHASVFSPDGRVLIDAVHTGFGAEESAMAVCRRLMRHGARKLGPNATRAEKGHLGNTPR